VIEPIVDLEWVRRQAGDVVLADVRWYLDGRSGRAAYEHGHLPGAVFVDLDTDLAAHDRPATEGRHPLPTPEEFAAALAGRGISDTDTVVAYDDSGGGTAGRLVVMLRSIGVAAALLDGGLPAGETPLESGSGPERHPGHFTPRPWPADRFVSADDAAAAALDPAGAVFDARAAERYAGEAEPVDPRAGHIPGARNAPWTAALDETGRFRDPADLRTHFGALGAGDASSIICYCGSGVSACADVLALERAGFGPARLFVGSWSAWSSDPDRPVETGRR
jgi:thiosulfate/3-mercaptopyruvate sulfurtransferase